VKITDSVGFFEDKRKTVLAFLLPSLLLAIVFGGVYLYLSDSFKPPPRVEVEAENCYDKTLFVVGDDNYAPYSYYDEKGNATGLDVELMNELANRLRMNLDLRLMDSPTAGKVFQANLADIIMNTDADLIVNNPTMIATLPIAEKQYVVYGKKEISSVVDLYGRRVASKHRMPGLGLDDEITYMSSYEDIFRGLKNGEFEYVICPIQVGTSFLQKLDIDDVKPSYAVLHVYSSLALHPRDTVLCVRLSAILKQMQEEGRLAELEDKWISHRYENTTVYGMIKNHPWLGTSIFFTLILFLLLSLFLVFQHRHAKAQAAYTRRLQENLATIEEQRTQLKNQQEELIKAKARAEQSSKAKTTFLFNMSHDIRTPMNAIIGYIELIKRESAVPGSIREFLQKIEASSQHLLALINDILEMSRIENGKFELEVAPMNICRALDDVRDMFSTQMQTKGVSYSVDTSAVRHADVISDEHRFNRVLLNLISNAYKFTPQGGYVTVKMTELPETAEGYVNYELSVKDSGIGMTKEFAERVFDAFERERTSTVSRIQGTGLGMAITKSIIDLMNGSIEVITAPGRGTEFIIRLQFLRAEAASVADEKNSGNAAQSVDFSQKRLLLVDDIEVNREIAKILLEGAGFIVDTAANGQEAVDKVSASQPGGYEAVLMDIQMPIMDGYTATKAIRALKDPKIAAVPIIAMTANAFSEDVQASRNAGMDGHIAKPIDVDKMMQVLAVILRDK